MIARFYHFFSLSRGLSCIGHYFFPDRALLAHVSILFCGVGSRALFGGLQAMSSNRSIHRFNLIVFALRKHVEQRR